MNDRERITNRDITRYLISNGVPSRFHKSNLSDYGTVASELANKISNPDEWRNYFKTKPVLNLYGDSFAQEEILIMLIRAFLLIGKDSCVVSTKHIPNLTSEESFEFQKKKVLGISHFSNNAIDVSPYNSFDQYHIEDFILNYLIGGGIIILASNSPINKFNWYSPSFKSHLDLYGREIKI